MVALKTKPIPQLPLERRHIRSQGNGGYGWTPGAAWWDYVHPCQPSGPDPQGWGYFITAHIWTIGPEFLAVSDGCHWQVAERCWTPAYMVCQTLEDAMDFCENDMIQRGTLQLPQSVL